MAALFADFGNQPKGKSKDGVDLRPIKGRKSDGIFVCPSNGSYIVISEHQIGVLDKDSAFRSFNAHDKEEVFEIPDYDSRKLVILDPNVGMILEYSSSNDDDCWNQIKYWNNKKEIVCKYVRYSTYINGNDKARKEKRKEDSKDDGKDEMKNEIGSNDCEIEHIVAIGKTGNGKSSLLKLLTKDQSIGVALSNDANSCTNVTTCHLVRYFDKKIGKNKVSCYYDTPGIQDSGDNDNDKYMDKDSIILNNVQRILYQNEARLVKMIWIMAGDTKKAEQNIQYQAKFVAKFANEGNNTISIWDSVLLIASEPKVYKKIESCAQGAIEAVKKCIDSINKQLQVQVPPKAKLQYPNWKLNENLIGYTVIDASWIQDNEELNEMMDAYQDGKSEKTHYYLPNQVETNVLACLNNFIKCYEMIWRKDKCEKCSISGDSRFWNDVPCHVELLKRHARNVTPLHMGQIVENKLERHHKGDLVYYHKHPTPKNQFHTGKIEMKHSQHIAAWGQKCVATAKSDKASILDKAIGIVGTIETPIAAPIFTIGSRLLGTCTYCECFMDKKPGCLPLWNCCNNWASDAGCKKYANGEKRYQCCKKLYVEGEEKTSGCYSYWDCCPEKYVLTGLALEVNENENEIRAYKAAIKVDPPPCRTTCTQCNQEIEMKNSNNNNQDLACAFVYKCCNAKGEWKDRLNKSHCCKEICTNCNGDWGQSVGCTLENAHHQPQPLP